jgi:hypothetical protein
VFFATILASSYAFAQKETGAIEGTITDNEGRPIPGATATASSSSLIGGSANAFTDQKGYYRFPVLAPGVYEVKAQLSGFQPAIQKNIRVFVGKTLTVDFTLELVTVSETVNVSNRLVLIDVSTPAVSFAVPPEIIRNLPKLDTIQDLMAYTPGVSDDLVAYGGDGDMANSIWVDGVNVSSPSTGGFSDNIAGYNYNWIDEAQVTGIGAPAEFGGFTGVVGNFITRSGGPHYHGLFETFFQNENLTGTNTPDPAREYPFKNYDITAQLGGPILRDKLWFFTGLEYTFNQQQPFGFDGVTTNKLPKFLAKLNYKLNQNNSLQGFFHRNDPYGTGLDASVNVLPEATRTVAYTQSSWNTKWISLFSDRTNFEGSVGGIYNHSNAVEDNPDLSGHQDLGTNIYSVNALTRGKINESRVQLNAVLSHYASDFLHGAHDFRFGVEFERANSTQVDTNNGNWEYWDFFGAPYLRYMDHFNAEGTNHQLSTYAQDEWNVTDRFNLSLGVRWDNNRGSVQGTDFFPSDPVAPRIGFVWTLDKDNQTVIKAHYGDYYDAPLTRNFYFLKTGSGFTNELQQINEDGQWVSFGIRTTQIPGNQKLKQPFMRQFTVGLDRVLPKAIPFGAHYIHRKWENLLEDIGISQYAPVPFINPLTGETITVYNLVGPNVTRVFTNPAGLFREYNGVEVFASKQVSTRISLTGSLVYSRLTGNKPHWSGISAATSFLNDPNSLINYPGHLGVDRTVAWKIVGTYALPWGFNTGWYFRHTSGDTWNGVFYVRLNQGRVMINAEPAGSRRLPSQNPLDMRIEKEFAIYQGQLRFTADVFNVFNSAYVTGVDGNVQSSTFGKPQGYNDARQIRLGIRYTF